MVDGNTQNKRAFFIRRCINEERGAIKRIIGEVLQEGYSQQHIKAGRIVVDRERVKESGSFRNVSRKPERAESGVLRSDAACVMFCKPKGFAKHALGAVGSDHLCAPAGKPPCVAPRAAAELEDAASGRYPPFVKRSERRRLEGFIGARELWRCSFISGKRHSFALLIIRHRLQGRHGFF